MAENQDALARGRARTERGRVIQATTLIVAICLFAIACLTAWRLRPIPRDQIIPTPSSYRININRADADELTLLPGVGPTIAQSIVDYREQHGPFTDARQLTNVRLIGEITLRKIEPWIILGLESTDKDQASDSDAAF